MDSFIEETAQLVIPAPVTFYIDSDYRCYTSPGEGRREMHSTFFAGREAEIRFYRFVPDGESWTRQDGTVFYGEMITLI